MASSPTYDLNEWVGGISTANYTALPGQRGREQQRHSGSVHPWLDLQADHGHGRPAGRGLQPEPVLLRHRHVHGARLHRRRRLRLHLHTTTRTAAPARSTSPRPCRSRATPTSTTWATCSGRAGPHTATDAIQNVAAQYGEGDITGIDLPDEVQGRVDSLPERTEAPRRRTPRPSPTPRLVHRRQHRDGLRPGWRPCVTPIEQAVAYATFANGGTRYAAPGGVGHRRPGHRQGGQTVHAGGHRARQPAACRSTSPSCRASKA